MEGRNLTLEVRSAEGRVERLADLATELVRLPVDLIVAHTTAGCCAAGTPPRRSQLLRQSRPTRYKGRGKPGAPEREHHGVVRLSVGAPGEAPGAPQGCSCQVLHGWQFSSLRGLVETRHGARRWSAPPGTSGWNCTRWRCTDPTTSSLP